MRSRIPRPMWFLLVVLISGLVITSLASAWSGPGNRACSLPRVRQATEQLPVTPQPPDSEPDDMDDMGPLDGLRFMFKSMQALIFAFQQETETFSRLMDIYEHGGPQWERVKREIDNAWRGMRSEKEI